MQGDEIAKKEVNGERSELLNRERASKEYYSPRLGQQSGAYLSLVPGGESPL
jgi:hypothetical protein